MVRQPSTPTAPRSVRWAVASVPLTFLGLFFLWPTGALIRRGLASGEGPGPGWGDIGRVVTTTVGLAAGGTLLALALGLPAAWALFRIRWRGQRVARALVSVPFVLPTVVVAAAFSALVRPTGLLGFLHADQSIGVIAAALAFFNVAVVVRVVGGTWASLDPRAETTARTLGASPWRAFIAATLPALRPAIGAATAVVFLFCSSSFGIVLILGGSRISTVETEIWLQVNQFLDLRTASLLCLVQVGIVGLALVAAGWARRRRDRAASPMSAEGARAASPRDRLLAAGCLAPTAVLLALPAVGLLERSLRTRRGWGFDHYAALLGGPLGPTLPVPMWQVALNSFAAAAISATLSMTLGLALAHALTHQRGAGWIGAAAMLPLGVSSVIVGLGVLLTLNRPLPGGLDLSDPAILIPCAQSVVALPLVVRALVPALRGVPPGLLASAATLGASPWRVWRRVEWPLVRRAAGLALGLAVAVSLGEFGATTFLARPDHPTLPTAIVRLLGRPGIDNVGLAFAAATILGALAGGAMMIADRGGNRSGGEI